MKIRHLVVLLIIFVFIIQPVSAGFFEDVFNRITGRVTENVTAEPTCPPISTSQLCSDQKTLCPQEKDEKGCPAWNCNACEIPPEEVCLEIPISQWCPDGKTLCPMKKDEKGCTTWDCNSCATTPEEECADSLDCPTKMKCENAVCVDVGCLGEGETSPGAISPEYTDHMATECCGGLKLITPSNLYDENCNFVALMGGPSGVCTMCSDGQCGKGETKCNCPDDCKAKATCTDSDGGSNYYVKGYVSLLDYPGGAIDKYDNCWDDGKHLTEYVCENGVYKGDHSYLCPDRCKDGACIKEGEPPKEEMICCETWPVIPEPKYSYSFTPKNRCPPLKDGMPPIGQGYGIVDESFCKEKPPTPVPPGCKRIIRDDGMEVIKCEKECPPLPEEAIKKCQATNGTVTKRFDPNGCPFIGCEYAPRPPGFGGGPAACLSEESLLEMEKKCHSIGLKPIMVKEGDCKFIKCSGKPPEIKRCAEDIEMVKKIKEECEMKNGRIVKHFDPRGCPMTVCAPPEEKFECEKDVPEEANKKCEVEGGDLIIKRDDKGCIRFVECVRRGNIDIIYEEIEEIPSTAKLLSIALKLESLKIEFDKMIRKLKGIATYYEDIGNTAEAEKFRKVVGLFSSATDKIEDIKVKLRETARDMREEDLRDIKHDIKYISELVMQDALYIILGGEIKLEGGIVTEEGYTDCGSDNRCWSEALRICEPVVFKPGNPPGIVVMLSGVEDEVCILEAAYEDMDMVCKIKDYATVESEGEDILQYCEGSLLGWLKEQMKKAPAPTKQPENCEDMTNSNEKDKCYIETATRNKDDAMCEKITERNMRTKCHTMIAEEYYTEAREIIKRPEAEGEVVFTDDFEGGTENWIFHNEGGGDWSIVEEDGNKFLRLRGVVGPELPREWNNYIFKFRFKRIEGSVHVNFRKASAGEGQSRYIVAISRQMDNLNKHVNENWQRLDDTSFGFDENWHTLEIRGYDNILNVYLDDGLLYKYKDTESPLLSGMPGFEIHTGGLPIVPEFWIDDVEIRISGEKDVIGGVS